MDRDDIERMEREAKGHPYTNRYTPGETAFAFSIDRLEHFVSLVAAAEREAIWDMLFEYAGRDDLSDSDQSLLKHLADLIRARSNP